MSKLIKNLYAYRKIVHFLFNIINIGIDYFFNKGNN
jgi:hypothetical protein